MAQIAAAEEERIQSEAGVRQLGSANRRHSPWADIAAVAMELAVVAGSQTVDRTPVVVAATVRSQTAAAGPSSCVEGLAGVARVQLYHRPRDIVQLQTTSDRQKGCWIGLP